MSRRRWGLVVLMGAAIGVSASASAQRPVDVLQSFGALVGPRMAGERIVLGSVTLEDGSGVTLDVSPVDVFTAGAEIVVHDDAGQHRIAPPSDRWFAGRVLGDADSLVVLAVGKNVRGLIVSGGRISAIAPDGDPYQETPADRTLVRTVSAASDAPDALRSFTCGTESLPRPPGMPQTASLPSTALTSVMYYAGIAVETDYELFAKFGTTAKLSKYVGDLFAAATFVYQRDVLVTLQVNYLSIWTTSSDPWTGTSSSAALSEFVNYWSTNRTAVPRVVAHMLAGRSLGGGIAYLNQLCGFVGYGVSGQLSGASPSNYTTTYWDFLVVTHELGHNFGSVHTHCYSPPVDQCYAGEGGCYSGPTSVPPEKGTIMSYCHLLGGYGAIKMFLGVPGEPSAVVATTIRSYVESSASCLGTAPGPLVTSISPGSGPISGGRSVTISGSGFVAGATVKIGGASATSVNVVNATTVTATTPPHAVGPADVSVLNPGHVSYTLAGGYFYAPNPVVSSIVPNSGLTTGGTSVTITGTGFQAGAAVTFGGVAATGVSVTGGTSLTATTGARAAGIVDVVVTNLDTTTGGLVSGFDYVPPPAAAKLYTVTPCRKLDTRSGSPIASNGTLTATITGAPCGIPGSAASVSVNVAETLPAASGHLRVYPADGLLPQISTLDFNAGQTRSNNAILKLSYDGTGRVNIYNSSSGTVHVIIDVNGYFQ